MLAKILAHPEVRASLEEVHGCTPIPVLDQSLR